MDYIVLNEDITDKYVYYNTSFYVRSKDEFGVVYVPTEAENCCGFLAPYLTEGDIAYNSNSIYNEFAFVF